MVEHSPCKRAVVSSILTGGSKASGNLLQSGRVFKASSWACTYLRMVNAAYRCPNHADIADRVYVMVEIRTVAGPSRALQCVLSGVPYTV